MREIVQLPNGLVFSLDEQHCYVNDTQARTIHCFDVNPEVMLESDRIFAQMTGDPNDWGADGITVDAQENIYCAGPLGVGVFDRSGELTDRIYAPEVITNLTWGDQDYKTLYLTGITSLYRIRRWVGGLSPATPEEVKKITMPLRKAPEASDCQPS